MFDIGFSEIIVCTIVGLIVIGPERLPEAVRTVGLWVGRIKRSLRETREELERQVGMEDVRKQLHTEEMMRTLADMQEEIDTALNYERMGKNKPVAESLVNPIPTADATGTNIKIVQEHSPIPTSAVIASTDQVLINTPMVKTIEKSESSVVHH